MPKIDIDAIRKHLGHVMVHEDVATAAPLRGMAATFDRDEPPPEEGTPIAPGWHLCYFLEDTRLGSMGADGLPLSRGVLPEMPLPRRMWAGGRFEFRAPLSIGDEVIRVSTIEKVEPKSGRSGGASAT